MSTTEITYFNNGGCVSPIYEESGVQELLGHRSVSTTQKYLGVNYATAREFVEAIAIGYERDETHLSHD